jgi:hexokinase
VFSVLAMFLSNNSTSIHNSEYIAECIKKAVVDNWHLESTEHDPLFMGMAIAFPVEKTTLDSGKLLRWTKEVTDNVTSGGTVGLDIVVELQKALDNIDNLHIKCNALLNDVGGELYNFPLDRKLNNMDTP